MPTKVNTHNSDGNRREKRDRRQRCNDSDSDGRDREDDASSRNRSRERRKKPKKQDRGDVRRYHKRRHSNVDSDFEGDDSDRSDFSNRNSDDRGGRNRSKPRHRDRRHRSKEKSSNKRRKKSCRNKSREYSDGDSDQSSDYDRRSDEKIKRRKKKLSRSRQERKDKKSTSASSLSIKKPDKSKIFSMGEPLGHPPDSKVNAEEDYFSYHREFCIYLFREEGICFNDIDTEESRAAFARFAKHYNAGMLELPYYSRTFPNEVIEESKTTKHSWGFKTTRSERKGLGDLQKGVRRQTDYNSNPGVKNNADVRNAKSFRASDVICPPVESLGSVRRQRPSLEELRKGRRADQRLKEHVRLTQEELTGGPKDTMERRLELKREHSEHIHGAHRDNEEKAAGMELTDAALFGDNGNKHDSFRSVLGRSRQKKHQRDERQTNRILELKAKEEERQKNMLKMLGLENLQGRGKVEIAPRK